MSEQTAGQMAFGFFSGLPVIVEPVDAQLSGDVGILPIRQFDDQIDYTQRLTACLHDPRDPDQIDHPFPQMVCQRLYGILAGYEDCNDHDGLRSDPVFKIVSGRAPTEDAFAEAAGRAQEAARPITDVRGTERQRRHLVGVLVKRALRGAVARAKGESDG